MEFWGSFLVASGHPIHLIYRLVCDLQNRPVQAVVFDNRHLFGLFLYELGVFCIVLWVGQLRGWSLGSFGFQPFLKGLDEVVLLYWEFPSPEQFIV